MMNGNLPCKLQTDYFHYMRKKNFLVSKENTYLSSKCTTQRQNHAHVAYKRCERDSEVP